MQVFWVEIPVVDLERAMAFYQTVFKLQPTEIITDYARHGDQLLWHAAYGACVCADNCAERGWGDR